MLAVDRREAMVGVGDIGPSLEVDVANICRLYNT